MDKNKHYNIAVSFAENTYINAEKYKQLYQYSIDNPDAFWGEQAKEFINWFSPWKAVKSGSFVKFDVRWFIDGKLNACYNCVDRHLETRKNQTAIIWQGDNPKETLKLTYGELHEKICRFANILKKHGVKKGDRVCIYLPMIPEIAIAMLACARIGAIHSVVFSAFSPDSLKARILDADCRLLITADEGVRGGKNNPLKKNADKALEECPHVKRVIVVKRVGNAIPWNHERDVWYHEEVAHADPTCPAEVLDSDDPLFILYTSGSTGNPKGILHTTGGYLVYAAITHKYVFNYRNGDLYWCTADIGWITGHSYVIYGPLLNGATTLIFEGVPHYPTFSRYWEVIDKYNVSIFYTAPTAIRALRKEGEQWIKATSRKSLKLLGSVGEPINPDVWEWYYHVIGEGHCPIVDTWWQTETGGILLTPLPGATPLKPGSVAWPFFGIVPEIVDEQGNAVENGKTGKLVIKQPWPGMMKTIYGDQKRFRETYFKEYAGEYLTGDGAECDNDGYFWIIGRNDDVIKVSGHRIGSGELENILNSHPAVAESAVVAVPHEIKGSTIYAYVTLKSGIQPNDGLKKELIQKIHSEIGPHAILETIQWTKDLPKTRSGKIMRRILRKIACGEFTDLGDTSTLADPGVVNDLISGKKELQIF
jgi:acetyl-CoA synthetase